MPEKEREYLMAWLPLESKTFLSVAYDPKQYDRAPSLPMASDNLSIEEYIGVSPKSD